MTIQTRHIAPEVARHLAALPEICRRHHVLRLDLFGSAARDDFDPAHSDVDAFRRYFGFLENLERLFGRHVAFIEHAIIRNPYVLPRVESDWLQVLPWQRGSRTFLSDAAATEPSIAT